jgi:hypothetical protein
MPTRAPALASSESALQCQYSVPCADIALSGGCVVFLFPLRAREELVIRSFMCVCPALRSVTSLRESELDVTTEDMGGPKHYGSNSHECETAVSRVFTAVLLTCCVY